MHTYQLDNDIKLFCVRAKSFPDGVLAAHQQLHAAVPMGEGRKYFGVSYPEGKGKMAYLAAAEEMVEGEGNKPEYEYFTLKSGTYIYTDIKDFRKDIPAIGQTFNKLLTNPDIDPQGCCVEWYTNQNDVRCMIRLK